MKRVALIVSALSGLVLSACGPEATVPACRAPFDYERDAFAAMISHNPAMLAQSVAPGAERNALAANEPNILAWVWGSGGERRGALVDILRRPPLCVFDNPVAANDETQRHILVYPQSVHDRIAPDPMTLMPEIWEPYGVERRDYLSCRFEMIEGRWRLADLCGYRPSPLVD